MQTPICRLEWHSHSGDRDPMEQEGSEKGAETGYLPEPVQMLLFVDI